METEHPNDGTPNDGTPNDGGPIAPSASSTPSRRKFLGTAAGTVAGVAALSLGEWTPVFRVPAASAASTLATPPNFPAGITLYQQAYQNWSEAITIQGLWTCAPQTPNDVVAVANWAHANGYRVRAKGMGHGWSPTLLPVADGGTNVVLLDTTQHLTAVSINKSGSPSTFTAQSGVTMDSLLGTLQSAGLGFAAIPAPGDLTLGGVLAIDAHGSAVPVNGEYRVAGTTYGSLSNNILALTAVVWSASQSRYVLKTFQRTDPDISAFLAHLGRAFVTDVTCQVGPNQTVRCVSTFDKQVTDVFAAPASAGSNSFASLLAGCGRIEVIWFPWTSVPWIKQWSVVGSGGPPWYAFSKHVTAPYNYTFANFLPQSISDIVSKIVAGDVSLAKSLGDTWMSVVGSGLITTGTWDIWGLTKDVYLYVQPTTLRIVESGFAVLCARGSVQQVVSDFYAKYTATIAAYAANGDYPMNGPIEIRVTGLDNPAEAPVAGAVTPQLSAVRPRPDHPEWDTVVWLDMGTLPSTPKVAAFYHDVEQWIWSHYTGSFATVRPEWSKGWASDGTTIWGDASVIGSTVPNSLRAGQPAGDDFDAARATLNKYDPARVFSNSFLDRLLP